MSNQALTPRFPKMLHGGDYNPDQWLDCPEILEEDIRLMKKAHCNCMSLAIFAWATLEPEEGVYRFEWLDSIINRLYENGIYTILATPSGARPQWMAQKYPEVLRVTQDRHRNLFGQRHNHCLTSPVYREKVRQINTKLAERYAGNPAVILWHISNEYSGECHCELCQAAFREYLKEKYKTLDALNHAWWTHFWSHTYTDWSQIQSPSARGETLVHGLNLDWKRFTTLQTADFIHNEVQAVKSVNPEIPTTINMMMYFDGLDYHVIKNEVDVISWDAYPLWHSPGDETLVAAEFAMYHDLMRSLKHKPFLLMESCPSATNWQPVSKLKRPGMHLLSSLQAVAHGSDSVQYFQWRKGRGSSEKFHGSVLDHYGKSDTRVFRDVTQVGKALEKLQCLYDSNVQAQAAVIFDVENAWAVADSQGPRNCGIKYRETVLDHYRALWEQGVSTDVIDMTCDLTPYRLVIAPMTYLLRDGFAKRVREFVENGGTFVSTYWSGIVNSTDLCYLGGMPGDGLMEVLGLRSEEIDSLYDGEHNTIQAAAGMAENGLAQSYQASELCDLIHCSTAQPLYTYGEDFYAGRPAVTVNAFGAGKAYYIASRNEHAFQRDFFEQLVKEAGIVPNLPAPLPHGVTVGRRIGDREYLFIQNFVGEPRTLTLPGTYEELLSGDILSGEVTLTPYDIRVLVKQ